MKYYLEITEALTTEQAMNAIQPQFVRLEFDNIEQVRDAKQGVINLLFAGKETKAACHVCGHEQGMACEMIEI